MDKLKAILIRLGIFSGSLVMTAVIAEGAVRILAARSLIYNIEMVKYASELKEDHENPRISHRHRKNAAAELMGVRLALNSLGHRSPEMNLERKPGTRRIFVLGSSVTMGWGVTDDEVFTAVVQKKVNASAAEGKNAPLEIFNAGIGNYNTAQQFALFNEQYPLLKPDMVVLHYFINDAEPSPTDRNLPIFKYSYLATYLYDWYEGLKFAYDDSLDLAGYYSKLYEPKNPNWRGTQRIISQMKSKLDKEGVKFLVMIVPDFHNLNEDSPYQAIYEKIETSFKQKNIPTVNLFLPFHKRYGEKEDELWIQPDDPHPNAKGHALMAKALVEYLNQHPL